MQFFVTFNVIAVTAILAFTTVSAEECNLAKLVPLATSPNAGQCTKDSGFSFVPPSVPTADKIPKLCGSTACKALLAQLKVAAPSECTISLLTPALKLYADVVLPIEKACAAVAPAPAATSAAPAPAATSAAPAPAATSAAPAPAATSVAPAPAATSAAPVPAPTATPAPRPTEPLVVPATSTVSPKPQC